MAGLVCFLSGCSTVDVDVDYQSSDLVTPIEQDAAKITIGQFSDRRGQKPRQLGELRGEYHFPKSILRSDRQVAKLVRDMVEQGAEDRGMLGGRGQPTTYQLYGQIVKLEGMVAGPAVVHAHLVIRLFDLEKSHDAYVADHKVSRANLDPPDSALRLGHFVEDALNQAIAESLDDPELRAVLRSEGT